MKEISFNRRAEEFIRSVVKQRNFLIINQLSKKNPAEQTAEANFLMIHLNAYPNRTDQQMAGFWNKNADRVFRIMPGKEAPTHESQLATFKQLNREAKTLIVERLVKQISIPF